MEKEDRLGRGIEQSEPSSDGGREQASGVEDSFRHAVQEIRSSRLGSGGVDALPWLLVMGESGEGKTAAVRESGLELPAEYATRVSGAPTESCDWWLTNDAILLDLAGRYLKCDDEASEDEWLKLLRLLRRQRPGCAINGIIFSISVDTLLMQSSSERDEVARAMRRRINEATDELGVDMPIYVVVTKLDHVEGFVECVNASPSITPGQAMGWTNDQRIQADPEQRVVDGFRGLIARLEGVLPELILREPDRARRRRIFAFPSELEQVVRATGAFLGRAFAETPYDAPPYLRGVYFTSARREGATVSPQLHRLGQDWARNRVDESLAGGGIFLRDLFYEIVIGDRELALPVDRFGRQTRKALGIAAGVLVALLTIWWLGSFVSNFMGIRRLEHEARAIADGSSSLAALDSMRAVVEAEQQDLRLLRRGGLAGPQESALDRARSTFAWGFGREYEVPTKRKLMSVVTGFDSGAFEALAQLATDVTWLVKARQEGEGGVAPDIARYAPISDNATDVEAFRKGYDAFVRWSSRSEIQRRIDEERDAVAGASGRLLELKRLEAWAESSRSYPPTGYSGQGLPGADGATTEVSGAYTRKAWDGLVVRLLEAIDSTGTASGKAKDFRETYVRRYDDQWQRFMMDTPTPINRHASVSTSPYVAFFELLYENTAAELPRRGQAPPWVLALREARRDYPLEGETPEPAEEGEEAEEPPPPPWTTYRSLLEEVAADTEAAMADGEAALALSTALVKREPTSFAKALKQVSVMVPNNEDPAAAKKLESILSMPVLDAGSAVMGVAFSGLDRVWRSQVVDASAGRLTSSKMQILYGEGGTVSEFRSGGLAPFYRNGRAVPVIGNRTMPFGPRFLRWMKSSEKLQRIFAGSSMGAEGKLVVRLQGVPARIIGGQSMRVAERELRMRCDDGTQIFTYTEGMGTHAFRWSPDCQELFLRITVIENGRRRELTPVKEWRGPMAMPSFLQEGSLSQGSLHWTMRYAEADVSVKMSYRLREGDELLTMRHEAPPKSMGR
jgi:type VI protein secretion system component VasK